MPVHEDSANQLNAGGYQKWVHLCYLVFSFLTGFMVYAAFQKLTELMDWDRLTLHLPWIVSGVAIGIGLIVYVLLIRNVRANQFFGEVMEELMRVSWPIPKQAGSITFLVIIMVVISGMFLGVLDYIWVLLMKQIL